MEEYIEALKGISYFEWIKLREGIDSEFDRQIGESKRSLQLTDSENVKKDLYKTVARNCFRYFGFTSFKQVDQLTLAEYELMMEALELRMLDESLHEHRQAFLNFAVKAEKKAGKGKTKPVYKRFRQFFDFDKELKKMKNRRKPSRFAGITKLLDREE